MKRLMVVITGVVLATAVARPALADGSGAVLLNERFDNPATGWLPAGSPAPERYLREYEGGEYVIRKVDPTWGSFPTALLPGVFTDASIAVDVRLAGEATGRYVALACRRSLNGSSQYRLSVEPAGGRFLLSRWDDGVIVRQVGWQASPAIRRGNQTNRLHLACQGSTIAASANGTTLATLQDGTHPEGRLWIGAGSFADSDAGETEARFDNLVIASPNAVDARRVQAETASREGGRLWSQGRHEEAHGAYLRALSLYQEDSWSLSRKATILGEREGRYAEAAAAMERFLERWPDDPTALNNLGWYLARDGRYEEGLVHIDRSLELRPDDANTLHSRAYALVGLGRFREALAVVQRAFESTDDSWNRYVRAAALAGLGRYRESLADLQTAIEKNPDRRYDVAASPWFDPLRDHPIYRPQLAELVGM